MDERAFYTEASTTRTAELSCPHCRTTATYSLRWVVRRKKNKLPNGADERDRVRFAKAQSYMVLAEDKVTCSNAQCRRRFEVSGIKTMAFLNPDLESVAGQPAAQPSRQQPKKKKAKAKQQRSGQRQKGQKKQQKQKKKKPKVYFPSDYIYYRP